MTDQFDGVTYSSGEDGTRLTTLMHRVYRSMKDGQWRSLSEISRTCGGSEASVSARLRDLRKDRFSIKFPNAGVSRKRVEGGLYLYRVVPVVQEAQTEMFGG